MKQTQILLINDMAGYGKVALSAMIPVLSHLKYEFLTCLLLWFLIPWIMVDSIF